MHLLDRLLKANKLTSQDKPWHLLNFSTVSSLSQLLFTPEIPNKRATLSSMSLYCLSANGSFPYYWESKNKRPPFFLPLLCVENSFTSLHHWPNPNNGKNSYYQDGIKDKT